MKKTHFRAAAAIAVIALLLALSACGAAKPEPAAAPVSEETPAAAAVAPEETPVPTEKPEAQAKEPLPFGERLIGSFLCRFADGSRTNEDGVGYSAEVFSVLGATYIEIGYYSRGPEEAYFTDLMRIDPVRSVDFCDDGIDSAEVRLHCFNLFPEPEETITDTEYELRATDSGLVFRRTGEGDTRLLDREPDEIIFERADYLSLREKNLRTHCYTNSELTDASLISGAWQEFSDSELYTYMEFMPDGRVVLMETDDENLMAMFMGMYYNEPNEENDACYRLVLFEIGGSALLLNGRLGLIDPEPDCGSITFEAIDFPEYYLLPAALYGGGLTTLYATGPTVLADPWVLSALPVRICSDVIPYFCEADDALLACVAFDTFAYGGETSAPLAAALEEYNAEKYALAEKAYEKCSARAREDYEPEAYESFQGPYQAESEIEILRSDERVLSWRQYECEWTGEVFTENISAVTLDAETGAPLAPEDCICDMDALKAAIVTKIGASGSELRCDDAAARVGELLADGAWSWALTEDGVEVCFTTGSELLRDIDLLVVRLPAETFPEVFRPGAFD